MRTLCLVSGVFSVGALFAMVGAGAGVGCGEPFTAGPSDGGGGGGGATSASTSSGLGGSEPATGGGGQGGCAACRAGEYCTARGTCARCTEFGDALAFGTLPSPITVEGTMPLSFPRVRAESGGAGMNERLVYVARFGGSDTDIGAALGRPWTGSGRVANAVINTLGNESGPLLLPQTVPSPIDDFPPGSLLFDSIASDTDRRRKLFAANALVATERQMIEGLNEGSESYSLAVAYTAQPYRYWFMNKRVRAGGSPSISLVTKRAADIAAEPLRINLPGGCLAKGEDLAPWVTSNGAYLFFQSLYSARGKCDEATVLRSFFIKLDPSGLPADGDVATLLLPTTAPNFTVMTPSLSADMCTLFFASDSNGPSTLFSASRR